MSWMKLIVWWIIFVQTQSDRMSVSLLSKLSCYAVRICGKRHKTVECLSVCLYRRLTAAAAAGGFAVEVGPGCRYRSTAAAAARHAGRVNFSPTVRRSNILVFLVLHWILSTHKPFCVDFTADRAMHSFCLHNFEKHYLSKLCKQNECIAVECAIVNTYGDSDVILFHIYTSWLLPPSCG